MANSLKKEKLPNFKENHEEVWVSCPTSKDIARLAKVSRATVSYVLTNKQDVRISDETKDRVWKAAAELGYVPNRIASLLRSGQSNLVIVPYFNWPYNASSTLFLQELVSNLEEYGYTVLLCYFASKETKEVTRKIAAFKPIGAIFFAEKLTQADVNLLKNNGVRGIFSFQYESKNVPTIGGDLSLTGDFAGKYLLEKGYEDFAGIIPKDPRIHDIGTDRINGLNRIVKGEGKSITNYCLEYDLESASQLVKEWKSGSMPEVVFTYNDEYGMLLMSALNDEGVKIPDEIALMGCDNLYICEMLRPRLTSIEIDEIRLAKDTASFIHRVIRGENPNDLPPIKMGLTIVERESC